MAPPRAAPGLALASALASLLVGCDATRSLASRWELGWPPRSEGCLRSPSGAYTDLALGQAASCVLRSSGVIDCWGGDLYALGLRETNADGTRSPEHFEPARQLSVGREVCAVLRDGDAACFGRAGVYRVEHHGDDPLAQVVSGDDFHCALSARRALHCWGRSEGGALGLGGLWESPTPAPVRAPPPVEHLAAGGSYVCGWVDHGHAYCWGDNGYGRLGTGEAPSSALPVPVAGLDDVVSVAAGWEHTCAARGDGAVLCWGHNDHGQVGPNAQGATRVPVLVPGVSGALGVAVGYQHSCALRADGTVLCWGAAGGGRLGERGLPGNAGPVQVQHLRDARAIRAGAYHTCALRGDGSVFCRGSGSDYGVGPRC